jgi:putative ABC transport system ATP-binding protein
MNRRCAAILDRLGLGDRADHYPSELSGGQQQRVAIARALVNHPALVLADEPTASLDAESGQIVMNLLREMAAGAERTTVLLVTHDQRVIDHADRIVTMVSGRIQSNTLTALAVRIARVLARSDAVKRLDLSEMMIAQVSNHMMLETRRAGEVIAREGDVGDRYYVIASGVAEGYKDGALVRELREGDGFGALTRFAARLIRETVRARTDLELFVLEENEFDKLVDQNQDYGHRIRAQLMAQA